MTWYKKKIEFPPDAYVVSCQTYMSVIIYFSGLYPWTSLMSHHCTANTKITTREDFSYVCTSTVLIPAGEEIVTNYVRVHRMFSRILSFLFVIGVFFWEKVSVFLRKNNNLYWDVVSHSAHRVRSPIMNPEFLQQFFLFIYFWLLLPGKSFKSLSKYNQKWQYKST